MKIGLDIHGTIDRYPAVFSQLYERWRKSGHEVHIMTGESEVTAHITVESYNIWSSHFFSIMDYHTELDDVTIFDKKHSVVDMDPHVWNMTKGEYARREGVDIMFDDSKIYGQFFPTSCTYIRVPDNGLVMHLSMLGVI